MSEQAPFDPNQGELFTEQKTTLVRHADKNGNHAAVAEVTGYLDYNGQFENGLTVSGLAPGEVSASTTQNTLEGAGSQFGFSVSGNERPTDFSHLPPPPTAETGRPQAEREFGVAQRLDRISARFEKYATKAESAYQKARRFAHGVGNLAASGYVLTEGAREVYEKSREAYLNTGTTNTRRVGALGLRAAGVVGSRLQAERYNLQEKAEDKVIDLLTEKKKRRQPAADAPKPAYPSRPSRRVA